MNACTSRWSGGLVSMLLVATLAADVLAAGDKFTLARAIPDDVFLYVGGQHNPEARFLEEYWGEVFESLKECGIGQDMMALLGTFLGEDDMAEVDRLKQRAAQLLAGVDWARLAGGEAAFAERLPAPARTPGGGVNMGPPDLVVLFRGSGDSAAKNFDGLVAILTGGLEEINKAIGSDRFQIVRTSRAGADVAAVDLLSGIPGAPPWKIAVARRDDVIVIAGGDRILQEVLDLLGGGGSKKSLGDDPRFTAAFAKLPPAEDTKLFFDMKAMLGPIRSTMELATNSEHRRDVFIGAADRGAAAELNEKAVGLCQQEDYKKGLELLEQAHEMSPHDSRILYNLACAYALNGNRDEAADKLLEAVKAGFYGPHFIPKDKDLESIRDDERYKAALAKAAEMAPLFAGYDDVVNSTRASAAYKLCLKAYDEEDCKEGLKIAQQACEMSPNDARILYHLACFYARSGERTKALDYLEKSVEGGFYCPRHISTDPDLESIRGDARYAAALVNAGKKATELAGEKVRTVERITQRFIDVPGILDHVAVVGFTEGYSVHAESIVTLVADARSSPIYPVFGKRKMPTRFDRYLPKETMSFAVGGGIDLSEVYKFIEDTFLVAGPKGKELWSEWEQIQQQAGIDVRKDVLDWIAGDYVTVTLENGGGGTLLLKVNDEDTARRKVAAAVEFLATKLPEAMAQKPEMAMLGAMFTIRRSPVQHEKLEGFENLFIGMSPQPIVWGVADGQLIFGTPASAVAACLETAKGEHPGIRENARVMGEALVPEGPFVSVTLTDYRALGQELSAMIGMFSLVSGGLTMAIPDPKVRPVISKITGMLFKLTPVVSKIDFFKSVATRTTFDGQSWHTSTVTHYVAPEERSVSAAP